MSKTKKYILSFLCSYFLIFVSAPLAIWSLLEVAYIPYNADVPHFRSTILGALFSIGLVSSFGLGIYCIRDAFREAKRTKQDGAWRWTYRLMFLGFIAIPVYFFVNFWPEFRSEEGKEIKRPLLNDSMKKVDDVFSGVILMIFVILLLSYVTSSHPETRNIL